MTGGPGSGPPPGRFRRPHFRAHERSFYRALKELKAIQTERAFRDLAYHDPPDVSPAAQLARLKEQSQSLRANPPSHNFPTYAQMVDDLVLESSEVTG